VTVLGAPVTVAVKVFERPVRTEVDDGLTATVTPLWAAVPELGSMRSSVASTASKFDPSSCPSVCRWSLFQRASG